MYLKFYRFDHYSQKIWPLILLHLLKFSTSVETLRLKRLLRNLHLKIFQKVPSPKDLPGSALLLLLVEGGGKISFSTRASNTHGAALPSMDIFITEKVRSSPIFLEI